MANFVITNISNTYRAPAGFLLAPNQSAKIADTLIDQEIYDGVQGGTYSSSPDLTDAIAVDAASAIEDDAMIQKIIAQFNSSNKAWKLPGDINPGSNPQDVLVCVVDGNSVVNSFDQLAGITVQIQADTTGGASISTAMPVTVVNGCATIELVPGGGAGDVVLELVDSETTGYDVSDTLTVTYV